MGGRSKERIKADKFSFVGELTNKRLSDYGSFTSIAYQRLDSGSLTQQGIPQNPEGLNAALSAKYQRRFGRALEWDLVVLLNGICHKIPMLNITIGNHWALRIDMTRRIFPYLPELPYDGDFPQLENDVSQFNGLSFSRYGSGKPGPFHCFVDDWRIESIWRDPVYVLDRAQSAGAVVAPDFSIFPDFPSVFARYQIWRSRLIAAYWQQNGVNVIPFLQWTHSNGLGFLSYFSGLSKCRVVAVRSPSRGYEKDWIRCAEIFQASFSGVVLHFGPKRGSEVWKSRLILPLNPSSGSNRNG